MSVEFRKLRWRNFLSTGDKFTEIDFLESRSYLITGNNGSGKSTLLDALSFALFGKPHRNINKDQLINTVNGKKCEVEVEFRVGRVRYLVKRGIKPGYFEIYANNKLVPQTSTSRDYQRYLELNILKLNHKTFHQVVVLGSSSFVPFMQLSSGNRRKVIEDLLDINVFTGMNKLLADKNSLNKEKYNSIESKISVIEGKIGVKKKHIEDLENLSSQMIQKKTDMVKEYQKKGEENYIRFNALSESIDAKRADIDLKKDNLITQKYALISTIKDQKKINNSIVKQKKFFHENDECPTCTQKIDKDFVETKVKDLERDISYGSIVISSAEEDLEKIETDLKEVVSLERALSKDEEKKNEYSALMKSSMQTIKTLQAEIAELQTNADDLNQARKELEEMKEGLETLRADKAKIHAKISYGQVIAEMLKDTGIKAKIIKQYLPAMNTLINQYLATLDFFVSFHLDESFQEVIKSRHRDEFSYASFSEGEKQRIDLALLFTWRQIAKMKNSVSTNLLVLDETFDSSLDTDGIDNLLKILDTLDEQTRVIVISHKGHLMSEKFESNIKFIKNSHFSQMVKAK